MSGPTDQEQLYLELINEARIDPLKDATRYITSYSPLTSNNAQVQNALSFFHVVGSDLLAAYQALTPVAPVAWNGDLANAAEKHSAAMIAADQQSHQVAGELSLGNRFKAEGYNYSWAGENVYTFAQDIIHGHAGFMVDWGDGPSGMQSPAGHRNNIMSDHFSEVGIDVTLESNPATQVGPMVVTQDFGERNLNFVLGVAYSDRDHDQFYSIGEGRADLQVSVDGASTTSTSSGGYALAIAIGLKVITLTGGGLSGALAVTTTIGTDSIKLDVVDGNTLLTSGSIDVAGPIGVIRGIGTLYGGLTLSAGAGNNTIIGTVGQDTLNGGAGNDILQGGDGNDTLNGGDGNDELTGGAGNDNLDGGNGNDVAIFTGAHGRYTLQAAAGGAVSVSGGNDGTDTVSNVEVFRFTDGDFFWNAAAGQLTTQANAAPVVASSQALSVDEGGSKSFTVGATDADGDPLTYSVAGAAHGTVTGGNGGVFTYQSASGFSGIDSFVVTVADGKGGSATQTVAVTVVDQNQAPVVAASQSATTDVNTAKQVTVAATDPDGDALTYAAGAAAHGSVSGGADGAFVYTPSAGYSGSDGFAVTVSDGHGGTASQVVAITVNPAPSQPSASGDGFRMFAPDGYAGEVGGGGTVFGTNGFQDISLVDTSGSIRLDASFNRGGDIVRLPGAAHDYTVVLSGSSAIFADGDTTYTIPVGTAGTRLVFEDGVRTLVFGNGNVTIGSQVVGSSAAAIIAPGDNTSLPNGVHSDEAARSYVPGGGEVTIGGHQIVTGTSGVEEITYLHGDVSFDPSFNRGGDILHLPDAPGAYTAHVSGSSLVLESADGQLTIPVGPTGMTLDFGGTERVLRFDTAAAVVKIGDLPISASSVSLGTDGPVSGTTISLDVGSGSTVAPVNLQSSAAYLLTDNAAKTSNVAIRGFNADDHIAVTGATASLYNFSSGDADHDSVADDLTISYQGPISFNVITIYDVVTHPVLVLNLATAEAAVGSNFITFG